MHLLGTHVRLVYSTTAIQHEVSVQFVLFGWLSYAEAELQAA